MELKKRIFRGDVNLIEAATYSSTNACLENLKEQLVLYGERAQQLQEQDNSSQIVENQAAAKNMSKGDSLGATADENEVQIQAAAAYRDSSGYMQQRRSGSVGTSSPSFNGSPTEMITDLLSPVDQHMQKAKRLRMAALQKQPQQQQASLLQQYNRSQNQNSQQSHLREVSTTQSSSNNCLQAPPHVGGLDLMSHVVSCDEGRSPKPEHSSFH